MKKFIEVAGDVAPYFIVGLVFLITILSLVSLVLVDVITGQITGDYLSGDKWFGLFSSLAGTGMLIACGALITSLWNRKKYTAVLVAATVFLVLQAADVYFDGISVDIKRFGYLISTATLSREEAIAHNVYRFFISGISFVGEPLGVGSLVAFPLLKKWLVGILDIREEKSKFIPNKNKLQMPLPPNFLKGKTVRTMNPKHLASLPRISKNAIDVPEWMKEKEEEE